MKPSPERYSRVINCQVIANGPVGRVLRFSFDIETELATLVMGAVGVPLLGEE